jgi:threonine/homoserine/homoserine lactone efflux protein
VSMVIEYPVLLAYSLLGARARGWLTGTRGRRALDALAGTALLGAAAAVASASLRRR